MSSEYVVGAVSILVANSKQKKSKKQKKVLFDENSIVEGQKLVIKPVEISELIQNYDKNSRKRKRKISDAVTSEESPAAIEKDPVLKRKKGFKRSDKAVERRKEKKRQKVEIRKLAKKRQNDDADEVNPKRKKIPTEKAGADPEEESRTVFVGNLPITIQRDELKKYFSSVGAVESVRLRSAPIPKPDMSKRVAVLRQEFHPERSSINGFVVFEDKSNVEKALSLNGSVLNGHHVRVDLSGRKPQPDHKKSVFVGNLPYNCEEEDLWSHFGDCGNICSVRIVRDQHTGVGKGFGYVAFKENDGVEVALKLNAKEFNGRKLRISRSTNRQKNKGDVAVDKKSKKKKWRQPVGTSTQKEFQGVTAKQGLKIKLAKKKAFGANKIKSRKPKKALLKSK